MNVVFHFDAIVLSSSHFRNLGFTYSTKCNAFITQFTEPTSRLPTVKSVSFIAKLKLSCSCSNLTTFGFTDSFSPFFEILNFFPRRNQSTLRRCRSDGGFHKKTAFNTASVLMNIAGQDSIDQNCI